MNTEKSLYLALRNLYDAIDSHQVIDHLPGGTANVIRDMWHASDAALSAFELDLGPLPDWASAHNIAAEPVLYAQLLTLNARRSGNAMIFHVSGSTFGVITDMGNTMALNLTELNQLFEIGDYIMKEEGYEKRKRQRDDYIEPLEAD